MLSQNEHRADAPLYIRLCEDDNVAIVANKGGLQRGAEFAGGLKLTEQIPQGHKVALQDIAAGAALTRDSEVIADAAGAIARGGWVREALVLMPEAPSLTNLPKSRGTPPALEPLEGFTFEGYRNPAGSGGTPHILAT